jgi:hypothetical protein
MDVEKFHYLIRGMRSLDFELAFLQEKVLAPELNCQVAGILIQAKVVYRLPSIRWSFSKIVSKKKGRERIGCCCFSRLG